jgi:dipeptidyl aminopeptidase/acylaminoacyl peptidase
VTTQRTFVGRGIHGCVSWEDNTLSALRSGARTPQQVVVYDTTDVSNIQRTILVRPADELWFTPEIDTELVEPSVHSVDNNGVTVPYRLYRSVHPPFGLIVWVHGGPTDQWQVTFRPRLTYWLSRGWSIVVVDHRGTTGHSRDFIEALEGQWGSADSIDTHAVLQHVQRVFGYRPERTVLMGGSAAGLTVLNTIAIDPDLCAGAVLSYPVVDLGELMRGDDPFETHYMPRLIGASSPDDPLLHARSPLKWAHRIAKVPVLIFHGDQDHSVPLIHSERLRNVVGAAGGSIRLEVMPGEGHGFRDPLNVIREYSFTEEFLNTLL